MKIFVFTVCDQIQSISQNSDQFRGSSLPLHCRKTRLMVGGEFTRRRLPIAKIMKTIFE